MKSSLVPSTAPFAPDEIATLDRVLSPASPIQRAWLSGFLAGLDAQARPATAQVAEASRKAEPLTILFASESGNSERLAGDAAKGARKIGFKPKIVDFAEWEPGSFAALKNLIVIAATWGEGEPPGRAARGYRAFMEDASLRLDGVPFGVLSLGDSAYAVFSIGKAIDARLEAVGGIRVAERVDLDLDFEEGAARWIGTTLEALAPKDAAPDNIVEVDFARAAAPSAASGPVAAEVIEHVNLNSSRSAKETIHLALGFEGAAPAYEPGDALELYAENDPALVEAVLGASGLGADDALRVALGRERDITTVSPATIQRFAAATGHAGAKSLLCRTVRWRTSVRI